MKREAGASDGAKKGTKGGAKSTGKKLLLILISVIVAATGIATLALMMFSGEAAYDPCNVAEDPISHNMCLEDACQFDTSECPESCPFGYDAGEDHCLKSCECAIEGLFQGDIQFVQEDVQELSVMYGYNEPEVDFEVFLGSAAIAGNLGRTKLWDAFKENGRIKVYYEVENVGPQIHDNVKAYSESTCIDFVERDNNQVPFFKFVDKGVCSATPSRYMDQGQPVSVGNLCNRRSTITHELLHLLAFHHEQTRPDRDAYVEILWDNIEAYAKRNFKKLIRAHVMDLGTEYDYKSIVQYGKQSFNILDHQDTIKAVSGKGPVTDNSEMSEGDIVELHTLYGCIGHGKNAKAGGPPGGILGAESDRQTPGSSPGGSAGSAGGNSGSTGGTSSGYGGTSGGGASSGYGGTSGGSGGTSGGGYGGTSGGYGSAGTSYGGTSGSYGGASGATSGSYGGTSGGGFGGTSSGYGSTGTGYGGTSGSYGGASTGYGSTGTGYGGTSGSYGGASAGYGSTGTGYGGTSGSYGGASTGYGSTGTSYGGTSGSYGGTSGGYGTGTSGGYGVTGSGYGGTSSGGYGGTSSGYGSTGSGGTSSGYGGTSSGGYGGTGSGGYGSAGSVGAGSGYGGTGSGYGGTSSGGYGGTSGGYGSAGSGGTSSGYGGTSSGGYGGTSSGYGSTGSGGTSSGYGGTSSGAYGGTSSGYGSAGSGGTSSGYGGTISGGYGGTSSGYGSTGSGGTSSGYGSTGSGYGGTSSGGYGGTSSGYGSAGSGGTSSGYGGTGSGYGGTISGGYGGTSGGYGTAGSGGTSSGYGGTSSGYGGTISGGYGGTSSGYGSTGTGYGGISSSGDQWEQWGPWSLCDSTCGTGKKSRFRQCKSKYGRSGYACQGQSSLKQDCQSVSCPVNHGQWATWSTVGCSVTCGQGLSWKRRTCSQYGQCSGSNAEIASCNKPSCSGGSLSRWGSYSEASSSSEMVHSSQWGAWAAWTACSKTCGVGSKSRKRQCFEHGTTLSLSCEGDRMKSGTKDEWERCNTQGCYLQPVSSDGSGAASWGFWSEWTSCTQTCLAGSRSRSRSCMLGARTGVAGCPQDTSGTGYDTDLEPCNTQGCMASPRGRSGIVDLSVPDNGTWSEWSAWSVCSSTCGGGKKTRTRNCVKHGKSPVQGCVGDVSETGVATEFGTCNTASCFTSPYRPGEPAMWGHWGQWSTCSKSCGRGISKRKRECARDGKWPAIGCKNDYTKNGVSVELVECSINACVTKVLPLTLPGGSTWSDWSPWMSCTKTCQTGYKSRERMCKDRVSQPASDCAGDNIGDGIQSQHMKCNTQNCTIPSTNRRQSASTWGEWERWSPCSVTCGEGFKGRTRNCMSKDSHGIGCVGDNSRVGIQSEYEACTLQQVCDTERGRSLTGQGFWSSCSATCDGIRHRKTGYCRKNKCSYLTKRCGVRCRAKGSVVAAAKALCIESGASSSWYSGDFNGDKIDDILCTSNGELFKLGFGTSGILSWKGSLSGCSKSKIYVADFDGDGRDDLLCQDSRTRKLTIKLAAKGGTFGDGQVHVEDFCSSVKQQLRALDVDKDGKADIVCPISINRSEVLLAPYTQSRP